MASLLFADSNASERRLFPACYQLEERRSKDVMHKMVKLWLQDQVDNIPRAKQAFDGTMANVEKQVNALANINDWSPGLGEAGNKPASGNSPALSGIEKLINDLVSALSSEAHVLGAIFTQPQDLTNQFSKLTVVDVLKKLVAILVDGVLSSIQVVVDTILNVLHDLAQSTIAILDSKIHIPVISDILNAIGISDLSFLDLFTWISAAAFTIVYKVAQGHGPFRGNDNSVKSIISAGSWDDMAQLFEQQSTNGLLSSSVKLSSSAAEHNGLIPLPDSIKKPIFAACHMNAGINVPRKELAVQDFVGDYFNNRNRLQANDSTRTAAILGEVSNLASYVSRLSYALAVNDEEQDSRLIAILVMGAANDVAFGLQLTESITGQSAFK